jgi:PhoH-like ATPase
MIKNLVIDTNILLQDPNSIHSFEDNIVIIPIGVIEELDKFKKDMTELGRNARQSSRLLDELRLKGDLRNGVSLGEHGILKVSYNGNLQSFYKEQNVDLHVIHIAQETMKNFPDVPCVIISQDVNVRIRANALGIQAEGYENGSIHKDELDVGYREVIVDKDIFSDFIHNKEVFVSNIKDIGEIPPNYYVILANNTSDKTLLGRVSSNGDTIVKLINAPRGMLIKPINVEQKFLIDALLDQDIKLVAIAGKAGTGKTLLSVSAAHYLTKEEMVYKRMLVSRPIFPMGKDVGYLPGELSEKLDPWMQPIYDAFDVITGFKDKNIKETIKNDPTIVVEPLTYIRGRSIHDQILIVDEAQNLTPLEIKTIITRAGANTKIILTGDIYQIDSPYIDSLSNGLSVVINAFRGSKIATSLMLEKGVRSELAEEASNKL